MSDDRQQEQSGEQSVNDQEMVRRPLSPELSAFEAIRHHDEDGQEYWLARELMK